MIKKGRWTVAIAELKIGN